MKIPQAHLSTKAQITRQGTNRAFSLNETDIPKYDGTTKSIHEVIRYLNVEKSPRYKRTATQTFCNIYAHDYARALGAYVPRVFWTEATIKSQTFNVSYGKTVIEMNANALYDWFKNYGDDFGWREVNSNEAQNLANDGKCVIMVAANKSRSRSGHIVAVVPETDKHKAVRVRGIMMTPLMSQAGATNKAYFSSKWWDGHEPVKIYVHG